MKEIKIFSYIRKYRAPIVLFSLLMGVLFYMYFSGRQVYTAQAIIQYTNSEAVNGFAPDDTEIDPTEIYSSEVMSKVFDKLGMTYDENNMDAIRAAVSVEAIQTDEESAVQTALNEQGEVAAEKPTKYLVSFSANKSDAADPEKFSVDLLSAMLNAYVETYAENHVNTAVTPNAISGIYDQDYDYIEMVEILEDSISYTLEQLQYKKNLGFRSADTGYSFEDLDREIRLLRDINISDAYAYILGNRITKDQHTLLAKYENRIENSNLGNQASQSQVSGIEQIIASYVAMMRRSGNSGLTFEYILDNVYDNYYRDLNAEPGVEAYQNADTTTEYDVLMKHYVSERTDFEEALIDIAYYEYILGVYTGSVDESGNVTVSVTANPANTAAAAADGSLALQAEAVAAAPIVSSQEQLDTAYVLIKDLTDRLDSLYQSLVETNAEYNRYAGAENISILTDTITTPALNLPVYAALSVVLFGIIGCVLAIVVGRLSEIFEYYAFVDKKLDVSNRTGCDRYIGKYVKKVLSSNYTCVYMKLTEIDVKNKTYGRERCDVMIADFCRILKEKFAGKGNFISLNGPGQFLVFAENMNKPQARACVQEIGRVCTDYNMENDCKISYICGISCSGEDDIYDIRRLMISAINKASASPVRRIS